MRIGLIAGHHRAFWYHWRDPGVLPSVNVKHQIALKYPDEPIINEHHEAEKLVLRANFQYSGKGKMLLCPFIYDLGQKKKWVEKNKIDWIISVHLNSDKYRSEHADGFEIWVNHKDIAARIKAQKACRLAANTLGMRNRGVKYSGNLYILHTQAHELLLEVGFINNSDDMIKMREKGVQAIIDVMKHVARNN